MAQKYRTEGPDLTADEATELCLYHLMTASHLYLTTPDDDNKSILEELKRRWGSDRNACIPAIEAFLAKELERHKAK